MLLLLSAIAAADPWSEQAAEALAGQVTGVEGLVVALTVEGEVPGWLRGGPFARTLAAHTGAALIRPPQEDPPWPQVALSLQLAEAEDARLTVSWSLSRLGERAAPLDSGAVVVSGPRPADPTDGFTERSDWPEIAALLAARNAAAQIVLEGGAGDLDAFSRVLRARLTERAARVQEIEAGWAALLSPGADPALRILGLTEIALVNDALAEALVDSEIPPQLTADQVEIYRMGLGDRAYGLEERAREALSLAMAVSREHHSYPAVLALTIELGIKHHLLDARPVVVPLWQRTGSEAALHYVGMGQWEAAAALLEGQPHNLGVLSLIVYDFQRAEVAFRVALEERPGDLESSLGLAVALRMTGQLAEAEAVLAALPQTSAVLWGLSVVYDDMKNYRAQKATLYRLAEQRIVDPRVEAALEP